MRAVFNHIYEAFHWVSEAVGKLPVRGDRKPIATVERLFDFASTRSAWVTQKKLYGYLKERIGIQYPEMFQDEAFARSINIAKMEVFAAALSDATVFVVATVSERRLAIGEKNGMALACYLSGLRQNADHADSQAQLDRWRETFDRRISSTNWENIAAGGSAFTQSPEALIRWAPIADKHKRYDREIVENSIRYAWNEVIQDFRPRLDARAVLDDWRSRRRDQELTT